MKVEITDNDGEVKKMLTELGSIWNIDYASTAAKIVISEKYYTTFPEKLEEKKRQITSRK